jgi:acetoin utilization deacetylase AcuC-like enzyme
LLNFSKDEALREYLHPVTPRQATPEELARVHPEIYIETLVESCRQGGFLDYGDTYVTPQSMESARLAAGGTLSVLDEMLDEHAKRGFAIIRPPGHHATQDAAMGFCLLNNIAIAVRHAQARGKSRIMIVDFDVHHGNGTQVIFDHDPDVLYLSTHQYGIFPGTGFATDIGIGPGKGSSVNIPLPPYAGDEAFKTITQEIINPIADRFMPEMLLVSAGFDGHWRDPLATLNLSTGAYFELAKSLVSVAERHTEGRLLYVLEGGYNPAALAESILASFYGLCELSPQFPFPSGPAKGKPDLTALFGRIREIHKLST